MTEPRFGEMMSIAEARAVLAQHVEGGLECPVCRQHVAKYRRRMTTVTIRALEQLYESHRRDWGHMPTIVAEQLADVAHQGGQATLSQHWGLIESQKQMRSDGGRTGYWRVTDKGERFVKGEISVPRYAHIYLGKVRELTGALIDVKEAGGEGFHLAEIRAGVVPETTGEQGPLFEQVA